MYSIIVTEEFRVDEYGLVYDNLGHFFCRWFMLTEKEKTMVKNNPASVK